MTAARTKKDTVDEFDALLETATLTDRTAKKRPVVDVSDKIVAFAQNLYNNSKAATFPVDNQETFDRLKLMWQSAGDKTTPPTSATVKPVYADATGEDGKESVLTGLRVSFGDRRGMKNGADDAGTANG